MVSGERDLGRCIDLGLVVGFLLLVGRDSGGMVSLTKAAPTGAKAEGTGKENRSATVSSTTGAAWGRSVGYCYCGGFGIGASGIWDRGLRRQLAVLRSAGGIALRRASGGGIRPMRRFVKLLVDQWRQARTRQGNRWESIPLLFRSPPSGSTAAPETPRTAAPSRSCVQVPQALPQSPSSSGHGPS